MAASDPLFAGVDAGATYTKAGLNDGSGTLVATALDMTGVNSGAAAKKVYADLLAKAGVDGNDVAYAVGTGYGRYKITFGKAQITEIACHAKGAHILFPQTRTVLDMGGQDTQAIRIDARGDVTDFCMNDKCAAGTGRFIEGSARALGLGLAEVGDLSLRSTQPVKISSTCAVFAEMETQEQLAWGNRLEDILYGVHVAIASRAIGLVRRVGIEPEVTFTSGVSLNRGMKRCLEEQLGIRLNVDPLTMFCGALGAAQFGMEKMAAPAVS